MTVLDSYRRYRNSYKNYLSVMWNVRRGKDIIKVILKNGDRFQWRQSKVWTYAAYKGNDIAEFKFNFFTDTNNTSDLLPVKL